MAKSMNGNSRDSDSFAMSFQHIVESRVAEYYYRTYRHLLGTIIIAEFDPETKDFRIISSEGEK